MLKMDKAQKKAFIAKNAATFFKDGDLVNLGIGIPTLVADYIPDDIDVWLDTENGAIGLAGAPEEDNVDEDLVDASGGYTTLREGGAFFTSFNSFGIIRGGHVDATVLGAYEVDEKGNLANWAVPGRTVAGMGGAMDLVSGAKKVIITMEHCDKTGATKIKKQCTLPLTAAGKVTDIVTDLCTLHRTEDGLVLVKLAPETTVEEVQERTEPTLIIPDEIGTMIV